MMPPQGGIGKPQIAVASASKRSSAVAESNLHEVSPERLGRLVEVHFEPRGRVLREGPDQVGAQAQDAGLPPGLSKMGCVLVAAGATMPVVSVKTMNGTCRAKKELE